MPVSELENRMSGEELATWQAFFKLSSLEQELITEQHTDPKVAHEVVWRDPDEGDE